MVEAMLYWLGAVALVNFGFALGVWWTKRWMRQCVDEVAAVLGFHVDRGVKPWMVQAGRTYQLGTRRDGIAYITCLKCGLTSYNANDVENFYCGQCGSHGRPS